MIFPILGRNTISYRVRIVSELLKKSVEIHEFPNQIEFLYAYVHFIYGETDLNIWHSHGNKVVETILGQMRNK